MEQQLRETVKRILMEEWDPIGVKGFPEASDEYDGYLVRICGLLSSGSSAEKVAAHLLNIETHEMGLNKRPVDEVATVAEHLVAARQKTSP